jgi:hypothetical protein
MPVCCGYSWLEKCMFCFVCGCLCCVVCLVQYGSAWYGLVRVVLSGVGVQWVVCLFVVAFQLCKSWKVNHYHTHTHTLSHSQSYTHSDSPTHSLTDQSTIGINKYTWLELHSLSNKLTHHKYKPTTYGGKWPGTRTGFRDMSLCTQTAGPGPVTKCVCLFGCPSCKSMTRPWANRVHGPVWIQGPYRTFHQGWTVPPTVSGPRVGLS